MNKQFIKANIEKAENSSYRFLASTSSIDRQGDSIDQSGWELKSFKQNPVILWAHRYDELPLGKVVDLSITDNGLEADISFASEEANPKAQQVKKLIDDGILNAVSVGFIGKERNGNIITKAELLEISIVPVPANQEALVMASKNIDEALVKDITELLKKEESDMTEIPEDIEIPDTEENEDVEEVVESEVIDLGSDEKSVEKSGRVISSKNRKILESTRDSLKNSLSEIEKLLGMEVATTEEESEEKSNLIVVSREVVEDLKYTLRTDNKKNDKLLSILKKL
jgi:HK97 family phage prohead protease